MAKTYTEADLAAAVAKARGEDPTTRPYRTIYADDGTVVCYPPTGTPNAVAGHNGPWTIGGEHPDDWYGVAEKDDVKGGKTLFATKGV